MRAGGPWQPGTDLGVSRKSRGGWAAKMGIVYTLLITKFLPVGEGATNMKREKSRMSLVVLVRASVAAVYP